MKKIFMFTAACSLSLFASIPNTAIPTTKSDLKITIYNSNLAFINDKRIVDIKSGEQNIVYEGIPQRVISESVIPTFSGINVSLYSQNYIYNLVSLNSMLKYSIDKEVQYYKNNSTQIMNPQLFSGMLISSSPAMIKDANTGKIETMLNPNQIVFSSIPEEMITKPSLVWHANVEKSGDLSIDLKYLTTGISWKSDYVLNLSKKTLDLNGWITIHNKSGVAYENAKITCLAGEVNKAARHMDNIRVQKSMSLMAESAGRGVKEESFSGYHIYKIPFKETILDKQKKQITFIEKKHIKYVQYGYGTNNYFENYGEQKMSFQNIIEFSNSKKNNLGVPLPSGVIRMYKKDSKGETHFVGEDRIKNIPNKETVKLKLGKMFDVVGDKKITKFRATKFSRNVETTYDVRNRGEDPVIVKISENVPVYGRKIEVKSSCTGKCSIEKKSAFRREFTIRLKAKETYSFTSEFTTERN